MDHRQLVGIFFCHRIHDVIAEVELVRIAERNIDQTALGILGAVGELVGKKLSGTGNRHAGHEVGSGVRGLLLTRKDHGHEQTVFAVYGDHAVRSGRIVVDAVALVKDFLVGSDLHQQRSAYDNVELLTRVRGQLDGLALKLIGIVVLDPVGLGDLVLELGSQVLDVDSRLLGRLLTHAAPGDGIRRQACGMTFQKVRDVDVECKRALVDE